MLSDGVLGSGTALAGGCFFFVDMGSVPDRDVTDFTLRGRGDFVQTRDQLAATGWNATLSLGNPGD